MPVGTESGEAGEQAGREVEDQDALLAKLKLLDKPTTMLLRHPGHSQ